MLPGPVDRLNVPKEKPFRDFPAAETAFVSAKNETAHCAVADFIVFDRDAGFFLRCFGRHTSKAINKLDSGGASVSDAFASHCSFLLRLGRHANGFCVKCSENIVCMYIEIIR